MNNSLTGNSYSGYAYQTRFCTAQLLRGYAIITTLQVRQDTWWPGHSHTLTNHNWKGNTATPQGSGRKLPRPKEAYYSRVE